MKSFTKTILIIAVSLIGVGAILATVGSVFAFNPAYSDNSGYEAELLLSEKNIEEFTSVKIETSTGNVEFVDSDEYGVEIYSSLQEPTFNWSNNNGQLNIELTQEQQYRVWVNFDIISDWDSSQDKITIYLPKEKMLSNVDIETSSGIIVLEDLDMAELEIKASSGSVTVDTVNADDVDINTSSGEIEISNCDFTDSDFQANSGCITLDDINSTTTKAETSSGYINLANGKFNKSQFNANSGNISINGVNSDIIKIETSSGEIDLVNCEFTESEYQANSGGITFNDVTSGDIKATTSSGTIRGKDTITEKIILQCNSGCVDMQGTFGEADIQTSSGNVDIINSRPENEFAFNIESSTIKINGENEGEEHNTGGKLPFKIRTNSGSTDLNFGN